MFMGGGSDWGVYQKPGDLELMRERACTQMRDCHLVPNAGHWVQQEQPDRVTALLLDFLRRSA
jgi:pimeloyl-ACP methyl ester carboxylesterase